MGRGGATIKLQVRNLKNGSIEEKSFSSDAKLQEVETEKRKLKYLYRTGEIFVFEDNGTRIEIDKDLIGERAGFFKKGQEVWLLFWEQKPLSVELPPNVVLAIKETDPGVRGDSATNIWKPAVLETGMTIKVPLFVNVGDKVRVDTRTGEYLERV